MRPTLRVRPEAWILYGVVLVLSFLQSPGQVTNDTRLELAERPGSFLAGSFDLWHAGLNFGEMQNQAYGFLFPQGAFFVLGEVVGIPTWVSQRLWMALVLIIALEGARRVALAAGLGRGSAFVAALAFALAPRVLSTVGVISAETLPGAVLPWVLLPILLMLRGWLPPLRAAVLSAAAVVCMGGVNAVEVLGSLPLPLIVVMWAAVTGLLTWRFAAQWAGLVTLAGLWWLLPLLVLGKYAPPFYSWVESSANTTGLVGPAGALRGSSHWVGLLWSGGEPWWPAAHQLNFTTHLVVVAAVVQTLGLIGLATWRNRLRTPFVLAAVVAFAALTVSYGSWLGSPFSDTVRSALDGSLQVFRNVHKIDPTLRLPIAIGFGHLAGRGVARVTRLTARFPTARPHAWLLYALPVLLVGMLAQPMLTNTMRIRGWTEMDQAWRSTHDYLVRHQGTSRALVLPGTGFAQQDWGWTLEEPLVATDDVNFATRSLVPLIPGQSVRFLTALNAVFNEGPGSAPLAGVLRTAGIGHVVVRRDLDRASTGSPYPGLAARTAADAGLVQVAEFGPEMQGGSQIEIYAVPGAGTGPIATPVDRVRTMSGSTEGVVEARSAKVFGERTPVVLTGEDNWKQPTDLVTDTNTRRERAFGSVDDTLSAVMQKDEPYRVDRSTNDYPGSPSPQVVAEYAGVRLVSASSSQGYADNFGSVVPQASPGAVLDHDARTRWVSSLAGDPEEQWIRIDFTDPRLVGPVAVQPVVKDPAFGVIRELRISAGGVSRTVSVDPTGSPAEVDLGWVRSDHVLVEITRVSGTGNDRVAIEDIDIAGLSARRALRLPTAMTAESSLLLTTGGPIPACRATDGVADCDATRARETTELTGMRRIVTYDEDATHRIRGRVVARQSQEALEMIVAPGAGQLTSASSVLGNDPLSSVPLATDGDHSTAWRPSGWDLEPRFNLLWDKPRRLEGLRISYASDTGRLPRVKVLAAGKEVAGDFQGSTYRFRKPLRGRGLSLQFTAADGNEIAVTEIEALGHDVTRPLDLDARTGRYCGFGPSVNLDGQRLLTRVLGTVGDVVYGRPMKFVVCTPSETSDDLYPVEQAHPERKRSHAADVGIEAGEHVFETAHSSEFAITRIIARPAQYESSTPGPRATVVRGSTTSTRDWRVASGPEAVLTMGENHNVGWQASVNGKSLPALRVDGWMQAWRLPASAGPLDVHVEFVAQKRYTVALWVGLLSAFGVLMAGAWVLAQSGVTRLRGRVRERDDAGSAPWPLLGAVTIVGLLFALVGPVAAVAAAVAIWVRRMTAPISLMAAAACGLGSGLAVVTDLALPASTADALAATAFGLVVGVVARRGPQVLDGGARWFPNWRGGQGLSAAAILIGATIWRWVLIRDSYWNQDDYYFVADAVGRPLTLDYLFQTFAGHVVPAKYLAYWLSGNFAPFDWTAVAVWILASQVLALWLTWAVLCRLLPGRRVRLVLFTAASISSFTLVNTLWWSAAMTVWPHTAAAMAAVLFLLRAAQGAGPRLLNHLGIVVSLLLGLTTTEQPLLITLVLASTAVLIEPGTGWRRVRGALRRWWGLWTSLGVLVVSYLVVHSRLTDLAGEGPASVKEALRIIWALVGRNIVPGLVSGPWQAELKGGAVVPAAWVVVVSCLIVGAVVAVLLRRGGSTARWALFLGLFYVAIDIVLVLSGRGGFGVVIGLDPRYPYAALHVAVLYSALVIANPGQVVPEQAAQPVSGAAAQGRWDLSRRSTAVVIGLYTVSTIVSVGVLVPHFQNPKDRAFVENLRSALGEDPNVVLLDRLVPAEIVIPLLGERALASAVFGFLPEAPAFNLPTPELRVIDTSGEIVDFEFDTHAVKLPIPGLRDRPSLPDGCRGEVGADATGTFEFDGTARYPQALKLEYRTNRQWDLTVQVGEQETTFRSTPGDSTVWIPLVGVESADSIRVITPAFEDPDGSFCLRNARMGRTWLPEN